MLIELRYATHRTNPPSICFIVQIEGKNRCFRHNSRIILQIGGYTSSEFSIHTEIFEFPDRPVVVMDNATFHKRQDIQNAITHAGHTLEYLPAYSPDLNTIEHKWAQAKAIRKQQNQTVEQLFKIESFYVT